MKTQSTTQKETVSTKPIIVEKTEDKDLYASKVQVTLPDAGQYYQLDNGRIDIRAVQLKWLEWVNNEREARGLEPYVINPVLQKTATQRSQTMKDKQSADHKRFSTSSYYDYPQVTNWFADRGVEFENINNSTYTENVGYAWFDCEEENCTNDAISALRRVFDYFMSEE
ncbi:MAG: hypothetical protein H6765_08250 [Candidatus Peribacteria bacterium]|nr:MAG: hypothetical protein H6765_08250 [Candidatus Peribacteria bacterium]